MMRSLLSCLLLLFLISLASTSPSTSLKETNGLKEKDTCSYTILLKTGTTDAAGTDAIVSLELAGPDRRDPGFSISNLEAWGGAMDPGHNYFETGDLDTFKGSGPCLPQPPCWMRLSHDNSGDHPGWFVDYVEVYIVEQMSSTHFNVNQWLALDEYPKQLFAERSNCGNREGRIIKLNSI